MGLTALYAEIDQLNLMYARQEVLVQAAAHLRLLVKTYTEEYLDVPEPILLRLEAIQEEILKRRHG